MDLKKRPLFEEKAKIPKTRWEDLFDKLYHKLNFKLEKLPRFANLILITIIFIIVFWIFKWINKGHVNLITRGDNVINLTILLLAIELLSQLWEFNGEEAMGWGGM